MQRINLAGHHRAQLPGLVVNTEVYCCAAHRVFECERAGDPKRSQPSKVIGKVAKPLAKENAGHNQIGRIRSYPLGT